MADVRVTRVNRLNTSIKLLKHPEFADELSEMAFFLKHAVQDVHPKFNEVFSEKFLNIIDDGDVRVESLHFFKQIVISSIENPTLAETLPYSTYMKFKRELTTLVRIRLFEILKKNKAKILNQYSGLDSRNSTLVKAKEYTGRIFSELLPDVSLEATSLADAYGLLDRLFSYDFVVTRFNMEYEGRVVTCVKVEAQPTQNKLH